MRLPKREVERRVKHAIIKRYGNSTVSFVSMVDLIWDLIEEREKYRDDRA